MMSAYTKQVINYQVVRYLTMGFSNNEVLEIFLMMKMHNDMRERTPQFVSAPLPRGDLRQPDRQQCDSQAGLPT